MKSIHSKIRVDNRLMDDVHVPLARKNSPEIIDVINIADGVVVDNRATVPVEKKFLLTITEAAEYFNIGINRLYAILRQPGCPFVVYVGVKKLIKRQLFEEYLNIITDIGK